jgi:hypothetical protein
MHTRLRVVGASTALSSPFDAKKQLSRLAELQSKVRVTAHQRPAHSDWGVNPFVRSPEVSNPQNCVYETSNDQAI